MYETAIFKNELETKPTGKTKVYYKKLNMSAPSAFIDNLIGKQVIIKLNTGVEYKGIDI